MRAWFLVVALALCGCKLDGFLYTPPRVESYKLDPQGDVPEETVTADRIERTQVAVSPEITLQAVYLKGNVQPPRAYVLYFHGKGGTLDSSFGRAKRWSNLGFDVLTFDYRGFGASTNVTPTEAGLEEDSAAVLQALLARVGPSARVVYYGHSLGCAANLQRAVLDPPRAVILESPFASIQDFVADASRMDLPYTFIAADGWSNEERISQLKVPVLLMHGLQDDYVRPQSSQILYSEANDPKKLVLVEGADHGTVPNVMGEAYGETIHTFLDTWAP